jgi:hypothetical protein
MLIGGGREPFGDGNALNYGDSELDCEALAIPFDGFHSALWLKPAVTDRAVYSIGRAPDHSGSRGTNWF